MQHKKEDDFIHNKKWDDLSVFSEITELKFHRVIYSFPSDSIISINRNRNCRLSSELRGGKAHVSEVKMEE